MMYENIARITNFKNDDEMKLFLESALLLLNTEYI